MELAPGPQSSLTGSAAPMLCCKNSVRYLGGGGGMGDLKGRRLVTLHSLRGRGSSDHVTLSQNKRCIALKTCHIIALLTPPKKDVPALEKSPLCGSDSVARHTNKSIELKKNGSLGNDVTDDRIRPIRELHVQLLHQALGFV